MSFVRTMDGACQYVTLSSFVFFACCVPTSNHHCAEHRETNCRGPRYSLQAAPRVFLTCCSLKLKNALLLVHHIMHNRPGGISPGFASSNPSGPSQDNRRGWEVRSISRAARISTNCRQEAFSGREDCSYCDEPGPMSLLLLFPLNIQERCQFLVVRQNNC